jgi:hypothetical protein
VEGTLPFEGQNGAASGFAFVRGSDAPLVREGKIADGLIDIGPHHMIDLALGDAVPRRQVGESAANLRLQFQLVVFKLLLEVGGGTGWPIDHHAV